jgi:hypothetical protein
LGKLKPDHGNQNSKLQLTLAKGTTQKISFEQTQPEHVKLQLVTKTVASFIVIMN